MRLTRSSKLQAPVIHLLFASSGIEPEVVAEAEPIELLPNLTIGVARTGHLIALKVLSRDDVRRPRAVPDSTPGDIADRGCLLVINTLILLC